MRDDVHEFCYYCGMCQREKPRPVIGSDIQPEEMAKAWEVIHIDLWNPGLESTRGEQYVLSVRDHCTKYVVLIPISDKSARSVARALMNGVFLVNGFPEKIVSDCGTEFVNSLNKQLCSLVGVSHRLTSPYHPAANGLVERVHRELGVILRCLKSGEHWDTDLPSVAYAINTSVTRTTQQTPFFLMFGRHPRTVVDILVDYPPQLAAPVGEWARKLFEAR
jgi:transposase InsO family protein